MSNDNIFEQYAELVKRYKSGDESAFTEIYEESKKMVYVTCLGILNNEQDAEDAMQETYITVYEKLGTLEAENTFVTWLKTIAANKARDKFKAKKNDSSYDDVLATEEYIEGDDNLENLPDALIMEKDKRDTFYKIIRKELSDEQFQTTLLYYYDELPIAQIAQIMDCPENTVKSKLRLARVKIKAGIEAFEKTNKISLMGAAAGTGSLGNFFNAYYNTVKVPSPKGIPGKVSAGAKSAAGKVAGKTAAKTAAKTGAKVAHTAAASGAKVAATTSLPKILAIVAASVLGVGVIGGGVFVATQLIQNEDEEEEKNYEIEYDGLYCNIDKTDDITKCLRFYSDRKVIFTEYEYDDDNCYPQGSWFNLDSGDDRVVEGTYEVDGSKVTVTFEDGNNSDGYVMKDSVYIDDTKYKYYEFDDIDGYVPDADITSEPTDTVSTDPTDPTDPTDTTTAMPPISGAYLGILYQYQNEILTYETLSYQSINYIDINGDGYNELIFLYCPTADTSYVRLAVYTYDSSSETAVLLLDNDFSYYEEFEGAVLLDNGNALFKYYREGQVVDGIGDEHGYLLEVEFNGDKCTIVNEWELTHGGDVILNGELMGGSETYYSTLVDYKSHMVFPLMPDDDTFRYYENSTDDPEYYFMSRDIFDAGDYYYFDDLVALLGGDSGSSTVTPTTETSAVASFSAEMKAAYLDIINNVTYADFEDDWGNIPDSGEFSFDLVYYNEDDIPELLVCLTRYESYARYTGDVVYANLYTFTNGEVIELKHKMCVVSNTITCYYPRENMMRSASYDHAGGMFYYSITGMNDDCTAMETTYYTKANCDLEIYPDGWGDSDGETWYYYIHDLDNHEYIPITESQFNDLTTANGDPVELVGTKTADEITAELS